MKLENQPDLQEIFTRAAFREIDNEHYDSAKRLLKSAGIPLSFKLKYFFVKDFGNSEYDIPANPKERPVTYSFVDFVEAVNNYNCAKALELVKDLQFNREKAESFFVKLFDDKAFLALNDRIVAP
jgi:hypothetical protein